MSRIIFISDTHNQLHKMNIPDGDILIHSGDATGNGTPKEISKFNEDLGDLPHPIKIFIPGNHDWMFQTHEELAKKLMTNAEVLIDQEYIWKGLKIYGSPWQPEFCDWAFNLPRGEEIAKKWANIPNDTNILVTHGPPYGTLDLVLGRYQNLGCEELAKRVLEIKPLIHSFGHIHTGHGVCMKHNTLFVNASTLNERYEVAFTGTVVEL